MGDERRRETRVVVNEKGFLLSQENADKPLIPIKITDVSFSGIGIKTKSQIPVKGDYLLQYSILQRPFEIPVSVVWTRLDNDTLYAGCLKQ